MDPGPDRGRIEGRSRGPSRTALRSAPVDIEREIKALRQYARRTSHLFSHVTEREPSSYEQPAGCRCALDVTPGGYSLVIRTRAHSTLETASVHRVPRQVLRAVACRYSRHGVFVRAPLASPLPHSARGGAAPAGHDNRWPRVQKANALYRSISLAAAPRSCMRLRLWQFKP